MKSITFFRKACLVIAAVAMGLSASAATYYVSSSGNDDNDGSEASPFKTLQYVCEDVAESGDVIVIVGSVTVSGSEYGAQPIFAGLTIVGKGAKAELVGSGAPIMTLWDLENIGSETYDFYFVNLTFRNGTAVEGVGGGAIRIDAPVNIRFSDCRFNGNKTDCMGQGSDGGAIFVGGGANVEIYNCEFNNNRAFRGGAIGTGSDGSLTIENSLFLGNYTTISANPPSEEQEARGGAISGYCPDVMINNCYFSGNYTYLNSGGDKGAGGGAMVFGGDGASRTIINSAIVDNRGNEHGGAVFAMGNGANYTFINTTIAKNECKDSGGIIFCAYSGGQLNFINCTLTGNSTRQNPDNCAGIRLMNTHDRVRIHNTILEGNRTNENEGTMNRNSDISWMGTEYGYPVEVFNSYVGNVSKYDGFSQSSISFVASSSFDYFGIDDDFYTLSQSGIGFTGSDTNRSYYYSLKESSPAISGGNFTLLYDGFGRNDDQFGAPRKSPACSIGAVEGITENEFGTVTNPPSDITIENDCDNGLLSGNLCEIVYPVGIFEVAADGSVAVGYYTVLGVKLDKEPESGLFIVKYSNGSAVKVLK